MPASRRSAVSVRSTRPDTEDDPHVVSRIVRTSIRAGRKPSKSQRFVKEAEAPINSSHGRSVDADHLRQARQNNFDTDTDHGYMDDQPDDDDEDSLNGADDGDTGDVSDDDILPSFGPQLSLEEPIDADVVDFSQMDFGDFEDNVCHLSVIHILAHNHSRATS